MKELRKWQKGSAYNKLLRADCPHITKHNSVLATSTKIFVFGGLKDNKGSLGFVNDLIVFYHLDKLKGFSSQRNSSPITSSDTPLTKKVKKEKKSKKNAKDDSNVGNPYNVVHKVHVNFNYEWSGQNPEQVFRIDEKLGQGAYGAVYKGIHRETQFILAIKEISEINPQDATDVQKEIEILKKCKNTNIVCYYGTCQKDTSLWILMDYCAAGSVRDLIERLNKPIKEPEIQQILQGTLKGLIYLHSQGIIHRDIKVCKSLSISLFLFQTRPSKKISVVTFFLRRRQMSKLV